MSRASSPASRRSRPREPACRQRNRVVRQLRPETLLGREGENPIGRLGWTALSKHAGQKALGDASLRGVEEVDLVQDEEHARDQLAHLVEIARFRLGDGRIDRENEQRCVAFREHRFRRARVMQEGRADARRVDEHDSLIEEVRTDLDRDALDSEPIVRVLRLRDITFENGGDVGRDGGEGAALCRPGTRSGAGSICRR